MASVSETSWVPLTSHSTTHSISGETDTSAVKPEENMSSASDSTTPTSCSYSAVTQAGLGEWQRTAFTPVISERAVDQPRPLKVIYIGAGISGILAAIKFRQAVPDLSLTIYEKNPELGGTWYENKYPGCACGEQRKTYDDRDEINGTQMFHHTLIS